MASFPKQIEPYTPTEILLSWNTGEKYSLPYLEMRHLCPCASCVDELSGKRKLEKTSIHPEIHPTSVQLVGKYAIQVTWSDGHRTGMYHFDRLMDLCQKFGKPVQMGSG